MKKSRFIEGQIVVALKRAETGTPVAQMLRRMGISEQTFHGWKKLSGGLGTGDLPVESRLCIDLASLRRRLAPGDVSALHKVGLGLGEPLSSAFTFAKAG